MDKNYDPQKAQDTWYTFWEKNGFFKPEINPKGKPYTIVLPPPNASGKMHTGNVLMIAIEDLLIRWKRMQGYAALWIPGTDHAGTETQITFERDLKKEGKSRFNYSRQELYKQIFNFVQSNKHNIENQIRQMGASVDWDRYTFTLDERVIKSVHTTFKKLYQDGLVYRGEYMVNYCLKCGTTYSDVETSHQERKDPLYYIKYSLVDSNDQITITTVRPEPIWADTHLAVNPKDRKTKHLIGKKVLNPLTHKQMEIIGDEFVDPKFGTGIVKLTPSVDKNDYEVALKHNLPINPVLDWNGKMLGRYEGLSVADARKKALEELADSIDKIDNNYLHTVTVCKAGHDIEPTIMPNWFIKVDDPKNSFKQPALAAIKNESIKIFPKWREITYIRWMEEMRDWPVSRQNVWGIQIPVWHKITGHEQRIWVLFLDKQGQLQKGPLNQHLQNGRTLQDIISGVQKVFIPIYQSTENQPEIYIGTTPPDKDNWIQETDTFDTWFSSGQWPLITLGFPDSQDFQKFYPTSVLETGWEIVRLWVSRMIMFGTYLTKEVPFHHIYLHGIVKALDGRKMSKSLGNVINPDDYIKQYGVDALRMGLISGTANGKDFSFPKDKVIAYKLFANKIWNMARFILMMRESYGKTIPTFSQIDTKKLTSEDKQILKSLSKLIKSIDTHLEKYRFADAGESIYQFMWHTIADKYIESIKNREDKDVALSTLEHIYTTCLILLHPFMPFVTEEIYQHLPNHKKSIMIEDWPTSV